MRPHPHTGSRTAAGGAGEHSRGRRLCERAEQNGTIFATDSLEMVTTKPIIPEVVEPDSALPLDLVALRRFAYLMDEAIAIPGTRRRVGIDAAVGLIPGVGDIIGGLLSSWIVISAVRHRVPMLKVIRMMLNILLDVGLGSIPLVGDFFDFFFEENVMNLELLMLHRNRRLSPRSAGEMFWVAVVVLTMVLVAGVVMVGALIALIIWIAGQR